MGSCVSKKAAGAGARGKRVAAPLPVADKESARTLPPVAEVVDEEEEEEVKEVVLSEAPRPPRPPPEPLKRRQAEADEEEEESAPSEACSASDGAASVESAAKEKAKAKAKLLRKKDGVEREAEKRVVDAPRKGRTAAPPEEREGKARGGSAGNARARSPSPLVGAQEAAAAAAGAAAEAGASPVVSGIGCRSGRFSPSAARRAAESAVRRTHSAREADMALPSKRSLSAAINGSAAGHALISRRDAGERSGRRSDSPTGRRAPASPSATHRAASPMRKAAKEHGTPERARARGRDGDEQPAPLPGAEAGGGERKKVAEGEEGALGQNPSVAMECFIFL